MSQIVKIECSNCESVETYEMDGCILIGWREGGLFLRQHEITLGEIVDKWIEDLFREKEEE